jgi:hypothetical protein
MISHDRRQKTSETFSRNGGPYFWLDITLWLDITHGGRNTATRAGGDDKVEHQQQLEQKKE